MKKVISLLITLILLISFTVNAGSLILTSNNCQNSTANKTANFDGGMQRSVSVPDASSNSAEHENSPIDCHACLGHCHSLHSIGMLHINEIKIHQNIIVLKLPNNQYHDNYKAIHLSNIFRPPILL